MLRLRHGWIPADVSLGTQKASRHASGCRFVCSGIRSGRLPCCRVRYQPLPVPEDSSSLLSPPAAAPPHWSRHRCLHLRPGRRQYRCWPRRRRHTRSGCRRRPAALPGRDDLRARRGVTDIARPGSEHFQCQLEVNRLPLNRPATELQPHLHRLGIQVNHQPDLP